MYNGHKNWNHWNVSLWLNNDEGLYEIKKRHLRRNRWGIDTKDEVAENILNDLNDLGITETPDGAPYSKTAIRADLVGE
jgi:hypothetical protein